MKEEDLKSIGPWSEVKLEILRKYAAAYSKILTSTDKAHFDHVYIDAFAGPGLHKSRASGKTVMGSPREALNIKLPFEEYYFIDLRGDCIDQLRSDVGDRPDVHYFKGDCNKILLTEVFPHCRYKDYKRALCLLDPYGLHRDWEVLCAAAQEGSIEVLYNFMIMDANMNVFLWRPETVPSDQKERMNRVWGDSSWEKIVYRPISKDLFGGQVLDKQDNETIAGAFRQRLEAVAGFRHVPKPIAMKNKTGATLYYLYFASPNETGAKIARQVFKKYRDGGA